MAKLAAEDAEEAEAAAAATSSEKPPMDAWSWYMHVVHLLILRSFTTPIHLSEINSTSVKLNFT